MEAAAACGKAVVEEIVGHCFKCQNEVNFKRIKLNITKNNRVRASGLCSCCDTDVSTFVTDDRSTEEKMEYRSLHPFTPMKRKNKTKTKKSRHSSRRLSLDRSSNNNSSTTSTNSLDSSSTPSAPTISDTTTTLSSKPSNSIDSDDVEKKIVSSSNSPKLISEKNHSNNTKPSLKKKKK